MASFSFGDPGIAVDTQDNIGGTVLDFANLGVNAFLANQAITSPRASSVQLLPNGQIVATGGGASPIGLGSGGGSSLWIFLIIGVLAIVLLRR